MSQINAEKTKGSIEVLVLSQKVVFGRDNEYTGRINGVLIRSNIIMYEIVFWKDDEMKVIQLYEQDFSIVDKPKKIKVGFIH